MLRVSKVVAGSQTKRLNAAVDTETEQPLAEVLAGVSEQLKTISAMLAGYIEEQVMDPDVINSDAKGTPAERLFDWTSDLFAISQDIDYYITPEATDE